MGHIHGYRLRPVDDGTEVTSYYDWSGIDPYYKNFSGLAEKFGMPELADVTWPVVPEAALRATLGILTRTLVHPRSS
jgi:hypothetical protein